MQKEVENDIKNRFANVMTAIQDHQVEQKAEGETRRSKIKGWKRTSDLFLDLLY